MFSCFIVPFSSMFQNLNSQFEPLNIIFILKYVSGQFYIFSAIIYYFYEIQNYYKKLFCNHLIK